MSTRPPPDPERVLAEHVFAGGRSKPFAELTAEEVKVASVAMAWGELGRLMQQSNARTVGDLDPGAVAERAEKLWVVPPGGSLL